MKTNKKLLLLGAFFAFSAVALGAFGAHGLKNILTPDLLGVYETAVRYQMYHALAILILAALPMLNNQKKNIIGWCFTFGIILFSGSLYFLALTGIKNLGIITPLGGIAFLIGWCIFFLAALKMKKEE